MGYISETRSRMFAIVIGIEHPGSIDPCVADAEHFRKLLVGRDSLERDCDHIVLLTNEKATRQSIFDTFRAHFIQNDAIQEGDVMIFFFSGAGYLAQVPGNLNILTGNQMVQYISPWNIGGEDHGIPYYALECMIHELAAKKGNNITVILDVSSQELKSTLPIPLDLDKTLGIQPVAALPYTQWSQTLESHVLLAGCSPGQVKTRQAPRRPLDAYEVHRRLFDAHLSIFTEALIFSLSFVNFSAIPTYTELIHYMLLFQCSQNQIPYCKGINMDAPIFNIPSRNIQRYQPFDFDDRRKTVNLYFLPTESTR